METPAAGKHNRAFADDELTLIYVGDDGVWISVREGAVTSLYEHPCCRIGFAGTLDHETRYTVWAKAGRIDRVRRDGPL